MRNLFLLLLVVQASCLFAEDKCPDISGKYQCIMSYNLDKNGVPFTTVDPVPEELEIRKKNQSFAFLWHNENIENPFFKRGKKIVGVEKGVNKNIKFTKTLSCMANTVTAHFTEEGYDGFYSGSFRGFYSSKMVLEGLENGELIITESIHSIRYKPYKEDSKMEYNFECIKLQD